MADEPMTEAGKRLAAHYPEEGFHRAFAAIENEARQQGAREERERIMAGHLRREWHIEDRPSGNCSTCKVIDPDGYDKAVRAALAEPPADEASELDLPPVFPDADVDDWQGRDR